MRTEFGWVNPKEWWGIQKPSEDDPITSSYFDENGYTCGGTGRDTTALKKLHRDFEDAKRRGSKKDMEEINHEIINWRP